MKRILAIETATEACSAALLQGDEIAERYELAPQGHARLILPMVESLLGDAQISLAQLDALAFGCGPGSFTGVRIATGVIQGMAFAADRPVIPVSSLAAMAQPLLEVGVAERLLCAFDARMGEVYWGAYERGEHGLAVLRDRELVCHPEQVPRYADTAWAGAGSGWGRYGEVLRQRLGIGLQQCLPDAMPRARGVARLALPALEQGRVLSAEQAQPVYLRDEVAKKTHER
jgi:tRNA threonylcarbamoyladenosine biosynthesis protein TsaB